MKLQKLSLFSLSILFLFAVSSFAYSYSSNTLTDLFITDPSAFASDISPWFISSQACSGCPMTSTIPPNTCGIPEVPIMGGPNTLGPSGSSTYGQYYRAYYSGFNFPAAATGLEFDVYTFYDFVPSNPNNLNFLDIDIDNGQYGVSQTYATFDNSCVMDYTYSAGVTIKAFYKFHFKIFFNHGNSNSMYVRFFSRFSVPSTSSSFGFRNLKYYNAYSMSVGYAIVPSLFPCYRSPWDGSACISCDGYCKTCTGTTNHQCTSCTDGYYDYQNGTCLGSCGRPFDPKTSNGYPYLCQKTCTSNTFYWYYNQACTSTCDAPLQSKVDGNNVSVCSNPCYFDDSSLSYLYTYLYPSGSCLTSCPSPLKTVSPYICQTPCTDPNDFMFKNGSCTSSCASPLASPTTDGIKYCNSPCSGQYIMLDGSIPCSSTCASPLVPKDDSTEIKYCTNPCDATGTFLYANSSCFSTCPSPLQSSTVNTVKYCKNPCAAAGTFLYPNGSCITTCASPLIEKNEPGIKYCINPCAANDYLYANGSCSSDCISPLKTYTEAVAKFCINPCVGTSNFLYNNGSCLATCNSPLIEKNDPGVKFCMNPCSAAGSYLLPNGSCSATCLAPLESYTEPGVKYCSNPCAIYGTFLYEDGVCQTDCPLPNIERSESIGKFCKYPCANTALYYYTTDGKCKATCEYPYQATETPLPKICSSSLSEEEIKQIKKLAETTDTANSASSSGILIGTILSSSDSTSVCMGPFSKMLSYVKYMDIVYPEKVQLMFQQQSESASKGGFTSKMVRNMLDNFNDHGLPEKFETYKANSSFFVNFWPALFNLMVILAVTVGVILLRMALGTCGRIRMLVGQVEEILRWNVILVTFCGNFGDIVLFTALEFQTMQFGNPSDGISFAVCLLMNLLCLFVVIKILDVNSAVRKSKQNIKGRRKEAQELQIEKNWSSYKALFACYRDQSYFQQIFLFIFIVRISLFTGIIGYLYKYPLLQAVIINVVNILILLYLLLKRPIKQLVNLIQQVVLELVLLPFNMCVLALAVLDFKGAEAIDQRKRIGNVMVYINVVIPILSVVLMASKFLVIGYQFYKQWKADKLKKQMKAQNVQKADFRGLYGDDKMNGMPNRIHARSSKPQIFVENMNNQTITNPMQTLDITQSQLDISSSQETSFVLNNSINTFIPQNRGRRPVRYENRSLLTPSPKPNNFLAPNYIPQGRAMRTGNIELVQAETVSNNSSVTHSYHQSPNQSPQRAGRIARRRNKINKERGSPSWSIGGFSEN